MPARLGRLPQDAPVAAAAATLSSKATKASKAAKATVAILAAVALTTLTGCTTPDAVAGQSPTVLAPDGWHGVRLDEPYRKPSLVLQDMNGRTFRIDRDTHRAVVLVTFGYTHCRAVCPDMLAAVAAAIRPLDPGTRGRIQLLFVTVDPRRDDGAALRAYLSRFDPTFLGLCGSDATVRELGEELGVPVTTPDSTVGDYTVPHGAQVVGFGPDGLAHLIWMPGTRPADLRADLVRLASSA